MAVADLVIPVFGVIVTGWFAGWLGYVSRSLADGLVHFAYNVAMPALLFITIAQEPAASLLEWRFLAAFGGGSLLRLMIWRCVSTVLGPMPKSLAICLFE
jgi:malonate transporter